MHSVRVDSIAYIVLILVKAALFELFLEIESLDLGSALLAATGAKFLIQDFVSPGFSILVGFSFLIFILVVIVIVVICVGGSEVYPDLPPLLLL